MSDAAKWRKPQPAKSAGQDESWWYADRDGITVVSERRRDDQYVSTVQARITRKQLIAYMREVKPRKR